MKAPPRPQSTHSNSAHHYNDAGEDFDYEPSEDTLQHWIHATLTVASQSPDVTIAVRLVSLPEMTELNSRFCNKASATNCLSFPSDASRFPDEAEPFLGDIALCGEVICEQAQQWQVPLAHHWAHLTVHSTLHLLGYDHHSEQDAAEMEAVESRTLLSMGLSDPWKSPTPQV